MERKDLRGKRVLLLGAETGLGGAVALALAEAGARVALVAATPDADTAFAVQRLARRLATGGKPAPAQAIDGSNEMAVRVMVRQVGKALGGLDALVFAADLGPETRLAVQLAVRFGARELTRSGGGRLVLIDQRLQGTAFPVPPNVEVLVVPAEGQEQRAVVEEVLRWLAGGPQEQHGLGR